MQAAPISSALVGATIADTGDTRGRAVDKPDPKAGSSETPTLLPVGALVDRKYAIQRVLGQGGMGVVYLARDIHTDHSIVLKAVRKELAHRPDIRARMLAEGKALAQIDHPNVVHLNAVVAQGEDLWLVMQFIDGETLDKIIGTAKDTGGMPIDRAVRLFRQIASGVGAAHQEGVIHRDLKPANVIIRKKDGVAKVMDFGIAKLPNDPDGAITKGVIGSLWYMSPEQVTGRRDLDARCDVYALGILFYQMLTGRVPFHGDSEYQIMKLQAEAPMPFARVLRAEVPAEIEAIIQRATQKDRAHRFQSCDELVAALDPFAPGSVGVHSAPASSAAERSGRFSATPEPVPVGPTIVGGGITGTGTELPIERSRRRSGAWVALIVLLVLAAGGAAAAIALGLVVPPWQQPHKRSAHQPLADAGAPTTSVTVSPAKGPLDALVGGWVGNGRDLDAVMDGDVLEFRVKNPAQFAPQDYQAGEARFVLRATNEPNVFTVEDRIRPNPPAGRAFDPHSRGTCQEVWTQAGSEPLRARWDGSRLSVEFVKIEPGVDNFVPHDGTITSCVGLRSLKAVKVVSQLARGN